MGPAPNRDVERCSHQIASAQITALCLHLSMGHLNHKNLIKIKDLVKYLDLKKIPNFSKVFSSFF